MSTLLYFFLLPASACCSIINDNFVYYIPRFLRENGGTFLSWGGHCECLKPVEYISFFYFLPYFPLTLLLKSLSFFSVYLSWIRNDENEGKSFKGVSSH
jgi:hypothetical protein